MLIPFVRQSRFFRALVLTTSLFSFLLWLYIVLRIVFNHVDMGADFIYGIRISFWVLGAIAFVVSFFSTFLYLWLWGRFDRGSQGVTPYEYRPP